jgi:Rrf2 family protein
MLRFTKQMDYGLIAMQHIAQHQGDGTVGVKRIADEFRIPPQLLAKVLQRLAKRGLVVSQSGPRGGYRVTLAPSEVTVRKVIEALEGPVAIVTCMANHADCPQTARCTLRQPAGTIQAAIAQMLDTMTLAHLIANGGPAGGEGNEEVSEEAASVWR